MTAEWVVAMFLLGLLASAWLGQRWRAADQDRLLERDRLAAEVEHRERVLAHQRAELELRRDMHRETIVAAREVVLLVAGTRRTSPGASATDLKIAQG